MFQAGVRSWRTWGPLAAFSALAFLLMRDLLRPGLLLTLDSPYSFYREATTYFGLDERWLTDGAPLFLALHSLQGWIPFWALERALLVVLFVLAGTGAYRFVPASRLGRYFAGLLYTANPFTYERFIAGHWSLLVAYAVTPWALTAFLELLRQRRLRISSIVALLTTVAAIFSIHQLVILLLMYVVILGGWFFAQGPFATRLRGALLPVGAAVAMFVALNVYWVVPSITAPVTVLDEVAEAELAFFGVQNFSSWGDFFDTAALYGFWRVSPTVERPGPWLHFGSFLPVLFLSVFGVVASFSGSTALRRHRWIVAALLIIGLLGLALGLGSRTALGAEFYHEIWDRVPVIRGFRESHKFIASVALAYAFLGGLGVGVLERWRRSWPRGTVRAAARGLTALLVIGVPVAFSFPFYTALGDQLRVTEAPADWDQARTIVSQTPGAFQVLVLPWHHYMWYPWLPNPDKKLANPARRFFDQPVLMGDDPGIGGPGVSNPMSQYVGNLLGKAPPLATLGASLVPLGVRYVVLFHVAGFEADQGLLARQEDLRLIFSGENITLYENVYPVSRFYGLGRSEGGEVPTLNPLKAESASPVSFRVQAQRYDRIVFVTPQNSSHQGWQYDGRDPETSLLGFLPVFEAGDERGEVVYARFYRVYLPLGVVSSLAGLVLLALAFGLRRPGGSGMPSMNEAKG